MEDEDRPLLADDPAHRLEAGHVREGVDELGPRPAVSRDGAGVAARRRGRARARCRRAAPPPGRARTSRAGSSANTWRASSDPIEPPAPVTRTVWPATRSRSPRLVDHARAPAAGGPRPRPRGSRRRSSRPETRSARAGTVRVSRPSRVASSTARRTTSPDAVGIAMSSRRAPVTRAMSSSSVMLPRTRWPRTTWFRLARSSSSRPTIRIPSPSRRGRDRPQRGHADVAGAVDERRDARRHRAAVGARRVDRDRPAASSPTRPRPGSGTARRRSPRASAAPRG